MPSPADTLVDLSFVTSIAKGNPEIIIKYLKIFLEDTPSQVTSMGRSIEVKDWNTIESIAHSLKSQLNFIGAKSTALLAGAIKDDAETAAERDSLPLRMKEFCTQYDQICKELMDTVKSLSGKNIS